MFPDIVSHTALLTAAARAAESRRADRLFDDPFAATLAGPGGESLLSEVGRETAVPSIAIRTHFYDGVIQRAVARGVGQVVLLGAGLDARAYRLGLPGHVRWLEVDRAPVLARKRELLAGATPTVDLHDVPGDACEEATFTALAAAGLDAHAPVLWVVEGLLCFLHREEIDALFARVSQASGPGSEVVFDVPNLACVEARGGFARAGSALLKRGLQFGTDNPRSFARGYGIEATAVHEGHPLAHFGRRPEPPSTEVPPGSWTLFLVHGQLGAPAA